MTSLMELKIKQRSIKLLHSCNYELTHLINQLTSLMELRIKHLDQSND
jgi:hypothetical protein